MMFPRVFSAAVVTVLGISSHAFGLIIMDPTNPSAPITNNTAPTGDYADFNYWENMLGVHTYLGDGYLITTAHTGAPPSSIVIQGNSYNKLSQQQLHAPGNASQLADLWVWKIGGPNPLPSLPTLLPITSGITTGEQTLMLGDGFVRAGGPTFWTVNQIAGDDNDVWSTIGDENAADAKGFLVNGQEKKWGTNKVEDPNVTIDFSSFNNTVTQGYAVNFSQTNATPFEAQATNDDSGSSVFVKRNGQWVLTGLIHGVSTFDNQPGASTGALSGIYYYENSDGSISESLTAISDLSLYADQLADFGVTVPEPATMAVLAPLGTLLLRRRFGK